MGRVPRRNGEEVDQPLFSSGFVPGYLCRSSFSGSLFFRKC